MARINLLTIHWGLSFGAVFQTYATCEILKGLGHSINIINLVNKDYLKKRSFLESLKFIITDYNFERFRRKYLPKRTNESTSIDKIKIPQADTVIVGSDQVWNSDITGNHALSYFLDFASDNQRCISFASSFGKSEWSHNIDFTQKVKACLLKFDGLSVRESSGKKILKETFGRDALHVLDPTLVYKDFENLVKDKRTIHQIFPFLLIKSKEELAIVSALSNKTRMPLFKHSYWTAYITNTPLNWLKRIRNSEIVITDSFHGLAFSLIFHKNFYIVCGNESKFTRLQSLLNLVGLNDRYIRSIEDIDLRWETLSKPIDYTNIDSILLSEREKAITFLRDNIN